MTELSLYLEPLHAVSSASPHQAPQVVPQPEKRILGDPRDRNHPRFSLLIVVQQNRFVPHLLEFIPSDLQLHAWIACINSMTDTLEIDIS